MAVRAQSADKINTLLQNLNNGSNLLTTLEGIKVVLQSTHPSELKELLKNVSFDPVFSCLNSTNREELELSRDILGRLLENIDVDVVLAQFHDELCMGLGHPQSDIRALCLKQIKRAAEEPSGLMTLLANPDLVCLIISRVGDDSLAVAKVAIAVLQTVGSTANGQELLLAGQPLKDLQKTAEKSETIRYRVFEIVTSIASSSPAGLEHVSSSSLLQALLADLDTDDDLIQLNAIEMLTNMATSQHAMLFLDQQGVMGRLENLLIGAQADPSQDFLIPSIIKFFGCMAHFDPKAIIEKHGAFLQVTFDLLPSNDPSLVGIAVETIGFIGKSADGKQTLNKQGQRMIDAMKHIGRLLVQPPQKTRVRALSAMQDLFTLQVEEQTDDILSTQEEWFTNLASKPLDLLLSLCKQPFTEIRCNALLILRVLVNQPWAARCLRQEPGFLEYLLDRSTEPDKEGKEVKFEVVKALSEAVHTEEIFGRPTLLRLKGYVREGPFFVQVQSEVAMEGAS
ncbi:26S proteasome non-ATPase regulatory subunit 5-like [Diadema antillarum]|uniref:26S proteasome non-ATPase regulatory subunit 5-like n=1 Tax=Diadema antillarum TaxID=105358 RepID=UPI003A85BA81